MTTFVTVSAATLFGRGATILLVAGDLIGHFCDSKLASKSVVCTKVPLLFYLYCY
jgi:hypothetical protein